MDRAFNGVADAGMSFLFLSKDHFLLYLLVRQPVLPHRQYPAKLSSEQNSPSILMSIRLRMILVFHFKIELEISFTNRSGGIIPSFNGRIIASRVQLKLQCASQTSILSKILQVCEWQQPLVDWQTPSLTKKKDGEMIQL